MPANLTPEYHDAEERFKRATTNEEKIAGLEEMLRAIPKHKGTEKMQADLKRRLSKLRKDAQHKKGGASQKPFHHVEREGCGRVVIVGPPNSGKSQLVANLTSAHVEVADYPFTTRLPQPGMMRFEDVQVQLVDMPPLAPESCEPWQLALMHQTDLLLVVFAMNDPNLLEETEYLLEKSQERGLDFGGQTPRVLVLANKMDLPSARGNYEVWQELYEERFSAMPFSAKRTEDLEELRRLIFELLDVVRIYTKAPGAKQEENPVPFVLKKGCTVIDAAACVHKDLAAHLKFARIWGRGKFDGQMVERDYIVQDGDLLEIHA